MKYQKPDPKAFYVPSSTWEAVSTSYNCGLHTLIMGPSGSGKSELVHWFGASVNVGVEVFNFGAMSEARTSLIGQTHFDPAKGTFFAPSRFIDAVQRAGIILLDEITRAPRDAFNIILPLLDSQAYVAIDESPETPLIRRHAGCRIFATANVGLEYSGTSALDRAFSNRFGVIIQQEWPPAIQEIKILVNRTGILKSTASLLRKLAEDQREMVGDRFFFGVSTRQLLAAGQLVMNGLNPKEATTVALANHFSSEGDEESERSHLLKIIQRYFA